MTQHADFDRRAADPLHVPETYTAEGIEDVPRRDLRGVAAFAKLERELHVEGTVEYEWTNGRHSIYRIRRKPRRPSLARRALRALESLIRAARRRK